MGRDDVEQPGDVEWLEDLESAGGSQRVGPWRRWPRPRLAVVVAAAVVAAVLIASVVHGRKPAAAPTSRPATVAQPSSRNPSTPAHSPTSASVFSPPVVVTDLGRRLLGVRTGWELFALGPGVLIRIQLARGRIVRTTVPGLLSSGPVSFVVGSNEAIIRPLDFVTGYVVPDGQPARELSNGLARNGPALPGPAANQFWVQTTIGSGQAMTLVDGNGGPTGVTIPFPSDTAGTPVSDGVGYLLFSGVGGAFDARPGAVRRVTVGAVEAVGPTRWLTVECDEQHHCASVVIDRTNGARHVLTEPASVRLLASENGVPSGVISPDGAAAAWFDRTTQAVHLLDLRSGVDHQLAASIDQGSCGDGCLVWSPDSHWLFLAGTSDGKVYAVDARTADLADLGVSLPQISQLAARSTTQ